MAILAAALILICVIVGVTVALVLTSSPELCQLIPILISPTACVAVQTGKLGILAVLAGAAYGAFFGFVLSFIVFCFNMVFSSFQRMNKMQSDFDERWNRLR